MPLISQLSEKMEYLLVITLTQVGDVRFMISKCCGLVKKSMLNMCEQAFTPVASELVEIKVYRTLK